MGKFIIQTDDSDDEALEYLAEQTSEDVEGVIEGLFKMVVEAYGSGEPGHSW